MSRALPQDDAVSIAHSWTVGPAVEPAVRSLLPAQLLIRFDADQHNDNDADYRSNEAPPTRSLALDAFAIRAESYFFRADDAAPSFLSPPTEPHDDSLPLAEEATLPAEQPAPVRRYSRPQAPSDLVKLSDRLQYVLEPPLDVCLARSSLSLPFTPFPFQWEGIEFLYARSAAILSDEMGLGKTMQSITSLRLLLHTGKVRNVLMICPKPLVSNWQRELAQWAPELPVVLIEGDPAKRRWQWGLSDAAVKIANYELLVRDREVLEGRREPFDLVVFDESQRVKNSSSATSQVARRINRRRTWALTGTPVENSAADLVSIFELVAPGHISTEMKLSQMGRKAGQFILRRTKDQVLADLPPKIFRDADLELSSEQRHSYELAEQKGVLRLTELGDEATIQHVFELVLRLKQICNFDPATGQSAKFERLEADLEEVAASGQKAIIFSQYVDTLETLAGRLKQYRPLKFHGRIASKAREKVLNDFREAKGSSVLMLSYGAGGVGLNLQCAGYVFLYDRWWNPAIEDQAINRAHRIGVNGPVIVSRYLSVNTIEQRIDQILRDKREIFDAIFSGAKPHQHLGMNRGEIFGLFNLSTPKGHVPRVA